MRIDKLDVVVLDNRIFTNRVIKELNKIAKSDILAWRGDWNTNETYEIGDVVLDADILWMALTKNKATTPVAGVDWIAITSDAVAGGSGDQLPFDIVPASPHASDDEFDGAVLSGWTNPAVTANTLALSLDSNRVVFEPSTAGVGSIASRFFGIYKAAPAGSFSVSAKIAANKSSAGTDSYDGIFVGTTGGAGLVLGIGRNINCSAAFMRTASYGEGASDWAAYDGATNVTNTGGSAGFGYSWFKLVWDSATSSIIAYWSEDGTYWNLLSVKGGQVQPDRIGLGMYAQGNLFHADKSMTAFWFRVTEP